MDITKALNIATTALSAQRKRMDIISSNLANAHTTRTTQGLPYQRQDAVFESLLMEGSKQAHGVRVSEIRTDQTPGERLFDPTHPDADSTGYVTYPNVDVMTEMVDLLSASRAYEASLTTAETVRDMAKRTLEIAR